MKSTILVVDDNTINLKLACDVLEGEGFSVSRAEGAAQAQELLKRSVPNVILMDIQMPGMDGLTLTRLLKADPAYCGIHVIALTAFAMKGDDQKALEAGCDGYITKPIETQRLAQQIQEILGGAASTATTQAR